MQRLPSPQRAQSGPSSFVTAPVSRRSVGLENVRDDHLGSLSIDHERLFAGHSLRSGFLSSAEGNGASIFKMMDVSRHKPVDTLRGYVRDAKLFKDHAGVGLL
jgi:hypothetical protein